MGQKQHISTGPLTAAGCFGNVLCCCNVLMLVLIVCFGQLKLAQLTLTGLLKPAGLSPGLTAVATGSPAATGRGQLLVPDMLDNILT